MLLCSLLLLCICGFACTQELPTSMPSSLPTNFPSSIDTGVPLSSPSSRPSSSPSSRPSSCPSSRPSSSPSSIPSSIITYPSGMPTGMPSILATEPHFPTSLPTAVPSLIFSSTHSSIQSYSTTSSGWSNGGSDNVQFSVYLSGIQFSGIFHPTVVPTAAPTLDYRPMWVAKHEALMDTLLANSSSVNQVHYSEVRFQGEALEGGCQDWHAFLSNDLAVNSVLFDIESVRLISVDSLDEDFVDIPITSTPTFTSTAQQDICANDIDVASIAESWVMDDLPSGSNTTVTCTAGSNTQYWNAAACGVDNYPQISVDMTAAPCAFPVNQQDACTVHASLDWKASMLPCGAPDDTPFCPGTGSIRVLLVTFLSPEPAPLLTISFSNIQKSEVTVNISLDGPAADVLCGVFDDGIVPRSLQEISVQNSRTGKVSGLSVSVQFGQLIPATAYDVYCFAVSDDSVESVFDDVLAGVASVSTTCCRNVLVTNLVKSIRLGESTAAGAWLSLEAAPEHSITIQMSEGFFPTELTFGPTSVLEATLAFTAPSNDPDGGTSGFFMTTTATLTGDDANQYGVEFNSHIDIEVTALDQPPATPVLLTAQFSDSGTSILITFDAPTDQAVLGSMVFNCAQLVSFPGMTDATVCQWLDTNTLSVQLTLATVIVGDTLDLVANNSIRAACIVIEGVACDTWDQVAAASTEIAAPTNAITPEVVISAPGTIGRCDGFLLDLTGSVGTGGRAWLTSQFIVDSVAPNVADIQFFLQHNYSFNPPVSIPKEAFSVGYSYTFSVTLCNFLGSCSPSTSANLVVLNNVLPSVTVVGPALRTITAGESLSIASTGFTTSCDGSKSYKDLEFSWTITSGDISTTGIVSESVKDVTKFTLSPYMLQVGAAYTVEVRLDNTASLTSVSASTEVYVETSPLVVSIAGGLTQSVRQGSSPDLHLFLDGSGSFDPDVDHSSTTASALTYEWTCQQTFPTFSDVCGVTLVGSTSSETLEIEGNSASTDLTSSVTLTVVNSATGYIASTSVSVVTTLPTAPVVSVRLGSTTTTISEFTPYNQKIKLLGNVENLAVDATCNWAVDDATLSIADIALTPVTASFVANADNANQISVLYTTNLVLAANVLPPRSTLVFSLSCALVSASTSFTVASMQVKTNGPPLPGLLTVSPMTGEEMSTEFSLSASLWTTDELPLTYAFGFQSSTGDVLSIKYRSEVSYASATLPAGIDRSDMTAVEMAVPCCVAVYDALSTNATMCEFVQVLPMAQNDTLLALLIEEQLAASAGNADATNSAISTASAVMNAVNCSAAIMDAINCSSLNRQECLTTSFTCGSCINDNGRYIGASGDSNEECVDTQAVSTGNGDGTCTQQSDCGGLFEKCNTDASLCYTPAATCPSDCNSAASQGTCTYENANTGTTVDSCLFGSTRCVAVCECSSGWNGRSCVLSDAELEQKVSMRTQLLDSLLTLLTLNDASADGVTSLVSSLTALTQKFDELSGSMADGVVVIAQSVLSDAASAGVAPSDIRAILSVINTASILAQVNANAQSNTTNARALRLTRMLTSTVASTGYSNFTLGVKGDAVQSTADTVHAYAELVQSNFVLGEAADESIKDSFRVLTFAHTTVSSGTTVDFSLAVPLTDAETYNEVVASDVSLPYNGGANKTETPVDSEAIVSVISMKASLFDDSTFNSDLMEVLFQPYWDTTVSDDSLMLTVTLENFQSADVVAAADAPPVNGPFTTTCTYGVVGSTTYNCSDSVKVTATCDGSFVGNITTTCDHSHQESFCDTIDGTSVVVSDGSTDVEPICSTVSFTNWTTTCVCPVLAMDASSTVSPNFVSRATAVTTSTESHTYVEAMVELYVSFELSGMTAADFTTETADGLASFQSMQNALASTLSISSDNVALAFTDVTARLRHGRKLLSSVTIDATVTATSSSFGTDDPAISVTSTMTTAFNNGNFVTTFSDNLVTAGVIASTSDVTLGTSLLSVTEDIVAPTATPTLAPTVSPGGGGGSSSIPMGVIVGGVIGGVVAVACAAYLYCNRQPKAIVVPMSQVTGIVPSSNGNGFTQRLPRAPLSKVAPYEDSSKSNRSGSSNALSVSRVTSSEVHI